MQHERKQFTVAHQPNNLLNKIVELVISFIYELQKMKEELATKFTEL